MGRSCRLLLRPAFVFLTHPHHEAALSEVEGMGPPPNMRVRPGGPHNAVFVLWGISDFDSITLTHSSQTGLEWASRRNSIPARTS